MGNNSILIMLYVFTLYIIVCFALMYTSSELFVNIVGTLSNWTFSLNKVVIIINYYYWIY